MCPEHAPLPEGYACLNRALLTVLRRAWNDRVLHPLEFVVETRQ